MWWCHVQLQSAARGTRLCVGVWVVRESLVGLCVYFGGTKKDFVEGGGDQINRGVPRIAWPVLGTPALFAAVCPLSCPSYYYPRLLFLSPFL